jgi:Terminase large subunit, T4likevirus-type, N-terminal/Terminase RNaseH-like domain
MPINVNDLQTLQSALCHPDPEVQLFATNLLQRLDTPYLTFNPRPDQEAFINDKFQGVACLVAGNGAGKDMCCSWKLTDFIENTPPPEPVTAYWVMSKTMDMVGQDCWVQSLSRFITTDRIESINYYRRNAGYPSSVLLKPHANGNHWILHFKSYDQGREALQGANIGGFYCSEQCPLPLLREIITRTRCWNFPGSKFYNCTPLEPDVDLENLYNDPPKSWKFYTMSTMAAMEAGHVTKEFIQQITETELEELIETRLTGRFASYQGVIYRWFKASQHVIKPFDIPPGYLHCRGLDLGFNDPTFCVWCARSPDGKWYVYKEYSQTKTLIKDHVDKINEGWKYGHPSYGPTWADHDAQDIEEYRHHGLQNIQLAFKESRNAGISVLQHLFRDNKLYIFDTCPQLIRQLKMYAWNSKRRDEPLHAESHGPDALRYAISSDMLKGSGVTQPVQQKVNLQNPYAGREQRNPFRK